jgi:hypothetical protein
LHNIFACQKENGEPNTCKINLGESSPKCMGFKISSQQQLFHHIATFGGEGYV